MKFWRWYKMNIKQKVFETVKDLRVSVQEWSLQSRGHSLDHFTAPTHPHLIPPAPKTENILDLFRHFYIIYTIYSTPREIFAHDCNTKRWKGKERQNLPVFWGSSWLSPVLQLPGDCPALPVSQQVLQQPGPGHLQSPAQAPFGCTHLAPKKKGAEIARCQLAWFPEECKSDFCALLGVTTAIPTIPAQPTGSEQSSIYPSPSPLPSDIQHLLLPAGTLFSATTSTGPGPNSTFLFSRLDLWKMGANAEILVPSSSVSDCSIHGFWASILPHQE